LIVNARGNSRDDAALEEYRRKRDPARTPEPVPAPARARPARARPGRRRRTAGDIFVIQEHHATSLHWDLRLERDGVLASWAVPRGLPPDPDTNHLAVHTEDHPMEYADFSGEIPKGEYGGGAMTIWDRGTYETEKWSDREVKVVLHGEREASKGRFVLFQTDGKNWMIHRMDGPVRPGWRPLPGAIAPMLAVPGRLPSARDDAAWCYELDLPGVRALVEVSGGRVRVFNGRGEELTPSLPDLRGLGETLGATQVLVDGGLVAFDASGHPALERMQARLRLRSADARAAARRNPAVFLAFDVLHLDGRPTLSEPYSRRRELLEELGIDGPAWKTSPSYPGGGTAVRAAAREQSLPGIIAKRADSPYRPGDRSRDWRAVKA
jgi:bifunctional non-homologous end joining protein LigD